MVYGKPDDRLESDGDWQREKEGEGLSDIKRVEETDHRKESL